MKLAMLALAFGGLVCTGAVEAVPVLHDGQLGFTSGSGPEQPSMVEAPLILAGDELHADAPVILLPVPDPYDRGPGVIRRLGPGYFLPEPDPYTIVVPGYGHPALLPAACRREYFTDQIGWASYLGARCLEETYHAARDLPQHCALTIRSVEAAGGRLRDVYDEYCLRRAGYTVSGW